MARCVDRLRRHRGRSHQMIPEEAVEAAAEGIYDAAFGQEVPEAPIDLARAALEADLPHLETALRKQIADDIQERLVPADQTEVAVWVGNQAARIVEEGPLE